MLVFACIAPHGSECVESLGAPARSRAAATREAMGRLAAQARSAAVETWLVVTPHAVRVEGAMAISDTERAEGRVEAAGPEGRPLAWEAAVDRGLARTLAERARARGVTTALVGYGASSGPGSVYPMDWGAIIPLSHLAGEGARVVLAVPSRALAWEDMVRFGEAAAEAAAASGVRVGLVASADLAHAHSADGPYGYDEAAAVYDHAVREAVEAGDLLRLLAIDPHLVAAARPEGQWQILVLAGALARRPMRPVLLSYEVPTYFGMLCAQCVEA
ncbi:MAG: extradiol ring-cleavage dioxygenase [Firmicutes bacterium]|nr:extradiol ring-cleavage dioxygenase [Bacillota bacterium]